MDTLQVKRKEFEEKIVQVVLIEIEKKSLTIEQAREITTFWFSKIKNISSEEELSAFMEEIVIKWPIFNQIIMAQQGEIRAETDSRFADDVVSLVRDGKLEEAVGLAKTANN